MILIYAEHVSERLRYVAEVLCGRHLATPVAFTNSLEEFESAGALKINYSTNEDIPGLRINPSGFLSERRLREFTPQTGSWKEIPVLFPNPTGKLPFDVFSAAFYMLSRYEEYLPYKADSLGRFPAEESLAFKNDFLERPVVDLWSEALKQALCAIYPKSTFKSIPYRYLSTIDIDNAWAYKHKGLMRTLGGFGRDISDWNLENMRRRLKVLLGRMKDPYDTFDELRELHVRYGVKALYFFLLADYGHNDKSVPFGNPHFQRLVRSEADEVEVGIHPGFLSNYRPEKLGIEVARLQELTRREVTTARQHFLILSFPETYRRLMEAGIREDHTMGFASHTGFRAGTCRPFPFYDLDSEVSTPLILHPFAAMDATLNRYMKLSVPEAIDKLILLRNEVRAIGGDFITLWHNESLSEIWEWAGWKGVYEEAIKIGTQSETV